MSRKSGKYQGREFTTTLQANTEAELDGMIKELQDYAHNMGMEEYQVLQKRPDPDGGWEATVKAHNWNGFKWLKEKFTKFKGKMEEGAEARRQESLVALRAEREREREKKEKVEAELAERQRRKAEKEAVKEAKLARKREVEEARAQLEREKLEREEAKKRLRREKYAPLIKAGEIAKKLLVGAPREKAKKPRESRAFREGAYGKVIDGQRYFWKTGASYKWQLQGDARELRASGYATRIVKQGGRWQLYYRPKPVKVRARVRIVELPEAEARRIARKTPPNMITRKAGRRRKAGVPGEVDLGAGIVRSRTRQHIKLW